MESKDLAHGALGSAGEFDVKFEDGKLVASADAAVGPGSVGVVVKIDGNKVIDAIEKAIPGQLDDAVLELLRAAVMPKAPAS